MHHLLSRTSITLDEAVSILLGRSTGPIEIQPMDDDEEADANCPVFCLRETLEDELDVLDGEYRLAKFEKRSADVVAEKQSALQRHEEIIEQANVHLCAIRDELNKGEKSVLKVDSALSNAVYTFITLHSFNEWVKHSAAIAEDGEAANAGRVSIKKEAKKRDKGIRQQDAILEAIREKGFDPNNLPRNPPGKGDVKASVRDAIAKPPLFPSHKVFNDQWQALRDLKLIAETAKPSSPQKVMEGDL